MHIGLVPSLSGSNGGIYQYSITMLKALGDWKKEGCEDEFVVFAYEMSHLGLAELKSDGWTVKPVHPNSVKWRAANGLRQVLGEELSQRAWLWFQHHRTKNGLLNPDGVGFRPDRDRWFRHCGIEMMVYPAPSSLSFETDIPYVMAIHDLQHRLQPEFPEVSACGEWERREYLFQKGARYATLLFADSEVGKEDILNFYGPCGVTEDRVKVLPFLPASYLAQNVSESDAMRVRETYRLPKRYLFYPAQFWPHKNHARIVQALARLKQQHGLEIPIVLCGSYTGAIRKRTFSEVTGLAKKLNLAEQVLYKGHVRDEDMPGLYSGEAILVMPTFFGPTNIPVLEAWAFGCPVLTSDIRGIREQVGDAGLMVDPRSVDSIADGIHRVWSDEQLRSTLIENGRRRLAGYTPQDYRERLVEFLEEAKARVQTEKPMRVRA